VEEDFPGAAFSLFQSGRHKINPPGKKKESLTNMKTTTPPVRNSISHSSRDCRPVAGLLIPLVFACFALLPRAQAVLPAPDGGYPGGNTAEGTNALLSRTSGVFNTAIGLNALLKDTTGSRNTANGVNALRLNTTGTSNTAIGTNTLFVNSASNNTAIGADALFNNTTGFQNVATGYQALFSNTIGVQNTAVGYQALFSNVGSIGGFSGFSNTATGYQALFSNIGGDSNTATGVNALRSNTIGGSNVATGREALFNNTFGGVNTATGVNALFSNIGGFNNTATGVNALFSNTTGSNNVATGRDALSDNIGGLQNTAMGDFALSDNTTGSGNIALGNNAGANLTTGNSNIDIGNLGVADEASTIRIGSSGTQNRTFIAGIRGVATGIDALPVMIDSAGQLGTIISSKRFKKEIQPMDKASEVILTFKPVTFHYKSDNTGTPQFGLIAEEVAEINPDLVVRDADGEIYTVRYDQVNAMLLNEFLKQHRKVEKLEAAVAQQQKDFDAYAAQQQKDFQSKLAEQQNQIKTLASGLEKVSAQLEVKEPAPRTVLND
jgi:hypothetical protein